MQEGNKQLSDTLFDTAYQQALSKAEINPERDKALAGIVEHQTRLSVAKVLGSFKEVDSINQDIVVAEIIDILRTELFHQSHTQKRLGNDILRISRKISVTIDTTSSPLDTVNQVFENNRISLFSKIKITLEITRKLENEGELGEALAVNEELLRHLERLKSEGRNNIETRIFQTKHTINRLNSLLAQQLGTERDIDEEITFYTESLEDDSLKPKDLSACLNSLTILYEFKDDLETAIAYAARHIEHLRDKDRAAEMLARSTYRLEKLLRFKLEQEITTTEEVIQNLPDVSNRLLTSTLKELGVTHPELEQKLIMREELLRRGLKSKDKDYIKRGFKFVIRTLELLGRLDEAAEKCIKYIDYLAKTPENTAEEVKMATKLLQRLSNRNTRGLTERISELRKQNKPEEAMAYAQKLLAVNTQSGSDHQAGLTEQLIGNLEREIAAKRRAEEEGEESINIGSLISQVNKLIEQGLLENAILIQLKIERNSHDQRVVDRSKSHIQGIQNALTICENPSAIRKMSFQEILETSYIFEKAKDFERTIFCIEKLIEIANNEQQRTRTSVRLEEIRRKVNQTVPIIGFPALSSMDIKNEPIVIEKEKPQKSPQQKPPATKKSTTYEPEKTSQQEVKERLIKLLDEMAKKAKTWETVEQQPRGKRSRKKQPKEFKIVPEQVDEAENIDYSLEFDALLEEHSTEIQEILDNIGQKTGDTSLHGLLFNNIAEDLKAGRLRNNGGSIQIALDKLAF
jgi:tetratricopeptide (TPR) repeat protein